MSTATVEVATVNPVVDTPAPVKKEKPAPKFMLSVDRVTLFNTLSAMLGTVEKKTTIPVLSCFYLSAERGALSITATALDISQRITVLATVKKPGKLCVSADALTKCLKSLPAGEVTLEVLNDFWLKVTVGTKSNKLVGMNPDCFPGLPTPPPAFASLPVGVVHKMIDKALPFISKEESRYTLNAAKFESSATGIRIIATDGHRLILTEHSMKTDVAIETLWHTTILRRILALTKKATGELQYAVGSGDTENTVFFKVGPWLLTSRIPTGQFPNYSAVMPKENKSALTMNKQKLAESLNWVALCADERSQCVRFTFAGESLKLHASCTDKGEAEETLSALSDLTEPITTGFKSVYVLDCLKAIDTDNVTFQLRDAQSSAAIVPVEQGEVSVTCVVMPMRI